MVRWKTVRKRYAHPMKRAAGIIAGDLRKMGYTVEDPFEMDADEYSVRMLVTHPARFPEREQGVSISIEIADSHDYEGEDGGYTFRLDIVEYGGRIFGGCAPFNYTDQCWVRTLPAIKERWELLAAALDADDISRVIEDGKHAEVSA